MGTTRVSPGDLADAPTRARGESASSRELGDDLRLCDTAALPCLAAIFRPAQKTHAECDILPLSLRSLRTHCNGAGLGSFWQKAFSRARVTRS